MTDRVISLVVALDEEYRIDDVQVIIDAIKMIKCVKDVSANIFSCGEQMNRYAYEKVIKNILLKDILEKLK